MNARQKRLILISLRCVGVAFFYACIRAVASEFECTSGLDIGNDSMFPGAVGGGFVGGGCYGGTPTGPPGPFSSTIPGIPGNPSGPTDPQSGENGTPGNNTGRNSNTRGEDPTGGDTPHPSDALGNTTEGSNVDRGTDTGASRPINTSDGLSLNELFNNQSGGSGGSSGGSGGSSGGTSLSDLLQGAGIPTDGGGGGGGSDADGVIDALNQLNN